MLKFNREDVNYSDYKRNDLNTSHVKVQLKIHWKLNWCLLNLNTSHVKVQLKTVTYYFLAMQHLNTSHVKVQQQKTLKK